MQAWQMGPTAGYVIVEPYRDQWVNLKTVADIAVASKWAMADCPDPVWTDDQIEAWQVQRTANEASWDLSTFNQWLYAVNNPDKVPPANEPQLINLSPNSVAANAPKGTTVGTLMAAGGTPPYTYSLTVNPGNLYIVAGDKLNTDKNNLGSPGNQTITVRVKDANNLVYDQGVVVQVT